MRYLLRIFIVLFLAVSQGCQAEFDEKPMQDKTVMVKVGDAAPDFTVNLLSGKSVTLSDYRDSAVVIVFFNTSDIDSRKLLSLLSSFNKQFTDCNFSLIALAVGEDKSSVAAFVEEKGYKFDIALDSHGGIYSMYASDFLPRTFVIDPLGRIAALSAECNSEALSKLTTVVESLVTRK